MPRGTGGNPIDPASKVLASLKILATGSFQGAVADSMNYSQVVIVPLMVFFQISRNLPYYVYFWCNPSADVLSEWSLS